MDESSSQTCWVGCGGDYVMIVSYQGLPHYGQNSDLSLSLSFSYSFTASSYNRQSQRESCTRQLVGSAVVSLN